MSYDQAKRFLQTHYCDDEVSADDVRKDADHWNWVLGNPERFPKADLDFICKFDEAAVTFLALS